MTQSIDTIDTSAAAEGGAHASLGRAALESGTFDLEADREPTDAPSPALAPYDAAEVDAILSEMTDPMNRYYRYPVAKAMLPVFMRLPFTPNHITAFHACIGIAAGVLIARGSPRELVAAFILAEARMIFDCLDGVVARAKKLASPYGRTIDEMGDGVGYVGMQVGALVHIHRHAPGENLVFMLAAGLLVPGWMAMTYDYYKRTFGSLLKGTNDGPAEELVRRSAKLARDGQGGVVVRFALVFEWLQTALLAPSSIPSLLERIRRETDRPGAGCEDPSLVALAAGARRRARSPGFRRLLRFASIVTGDNAITFFNFGLLTFAVAAVEKTMIAAGFTTFLVVSLTCASWLRRGAEPAPPSPRPAEAK